MLFKPCRYEDHGCDESVVFGFSFELDALAPFDLRVMGALVELGDTASVTLPTEIGEVALDVWLPDGFAWLAFVSLSVAFTRITAEASGKTPEDVRL
jgi:hypothetical protein